MSDINKMISGAQVTVKIDAANIVQRFKGKIGHITTCVGHVYPCCFLVEFPDESVGCFMGTELEVSSYNYIKENVC